MRFNPRPPSLAGVALVEGTMDSALPVSIRARHRWRALPRRDQRSTRHDTFQSAPAIAGGRCLMHLYLPLSMVVSIRARHRWRALLDCRLPW